MTRMKDSSVFAHKASNPTQDALIEERFAIRIKTKKICQTTTVALSTFVDF